MADSRDEEAAHLEELVTIQQRRLRILEVQIARFGESAAPPEKLLERDDLKHDLAKQLAALRRVRRPATAERSPYLGLLTFQETDAGRFFGRDLLIATLLERSSRTSFLAVLGPSGSGKSSVVRAGLIPALKGGEPPGAEHWRYATLKPGERPLDTLAVELTKLQGGNLDQAINLSRTLAESDHALLVAADMVLDRSTGQRLVLVVDQFEELWTLAPKEPAPQATTVVQQQQAFIQLLLTAAAAREAPLLIVITMRADFLHRAAEHAALARAIADNLVIVSPMSREELREAIERPADIAGYSFEPGLADELIDQGSDQSRSLPLLEYTLSELWKQRTPDGILTWATYHSFLGTEGILARRADTILSEHYTPTQRAELREVLVRLVQPGEGTTDTRRRVRLEDLVPAGDTLADLQALLQPLVEARLLVISGSAESELGRASTDTHVQTNGVRSDEYTSDLQSLAPATVEIAHEALIHAWPTLLRWIDEDRANLRRKLQLAAAAQEWDTNSRSADFLWSGRRLEQVEAWVTEAKPRLNQRDQSFLDASRAAEQQRLAAEQAARRREETQAQQVAAERIARRQLRQIIGSATGSGLGYSIGLLYLTMAANAGALLTGRTPVSWDTALLFLLQFATAGALVGPAIVVSLLRRNQNGWRGRLTTPLFGALASAIPLLLFVLLYTPHADLTPGVLTRFALAGAMMGAGLGIGASATTDSWRQLGAIMLSETLAVALADVLVGIPPVSLPAALIGGAILGGLTGTGFFITAANGPRSSREGVSHEQI